MSNHLGDVTWVIRVGSGDLSFVVEWWDVGMVLEAFYFEEFGVKKFEKLFEANYRTLGGC